MFTFEIIGGGYCIYKDGELYLAQSGDPRLSCVEPMVLAPFANADEAEEHARAVIADMTPPIDAATAPAATAT
ncbi:MAG: hypothetical protein M3Y65_24825 [Pseudomonadota bacterium]|nr:hypothetical protein [Pseudomonadota bacterium]